MNKHASSNSSILIMNVHVKSKQFKLEIIAPDKYEHYFLQEWKDEQESSFLELQNRIEKMSNELAIYNREQVAIASSGQMDIELRRKTQNPSIGIEFFIVDDEHFQDEFEDQRYEELVFVRDAVEKRLFTVFLMNYGDLMTNVLFILLKI